MTRRKICDMARYCFFFCLCLCFLRFERFEGKEKEVSSKKILIITMKFVIRKQQFD